MNLQFTTFNGQEVFKFTKLNEWAIYLLSYPSVKASMVKNYTDLVAAHVKENTEEHALLHILAKRCKEQ